MDEQQDQAELMAIFQATPEALTELLQLPAGAYIDGVQAALDRPGVLDVRIRGAGWPTRPGMVIMRTLPTVTKNFPDSGGPPRISIDWGVPQRNGKPPNGSDNRNDPAAET